MNIVFIVDKVLIYGLFGYYLIHIFLNEENLLKGPFSIFYALFSLFAIYSRDLSIVWLYSFGIAYGCLLNVVLKLIDKKLTCSLNPKWFGLLNLFNVMVLERILNPFILESSISGILCLSIFGLLILLIDVIVVFRKIM